MEKANNDIMDEFSFLMSENYDLEISDNSTDLYSWCMKNGEYGKQILEEWSEKNKEFTGEVMDPRGISYKDTRKYWWHCRDCGEDYYSQLYKRIHNNRGCPHCAPERWGRKNSENRAITAQSIRDYCNQSSVVGDIIIEEWDEDRNMEAGHTLDNTPYSSNKTTYWICSNCGKHYEKVAYSRVRLNQGCPDCGRAGTSLPEQLIFWSFKQIDPETKNRYKMDGIEYDIYIPKYNLYIEFNGSYWHKHKKKRDESKRDYCKEKGGRFIAIQGVREAQEDVFTAEEIILYERSAEFEKKIIKSIEYIFNEYDMEGEGIDYELAMYEASHHMYTPVENNVEEKCPWLVEEFDESNKGFDLKSFTCGSRKIVKWKCKRCGKKWNERISERALMHKGCSRCGYNSYDNKVHDRAIRRQAICDFGKYNL